MEAKEGGSLHIESNVNADSTGMFVNGSNFTASKADTKGGAIFIRTLGSGSNFY